MQKILFLILFLITIQSVNAQSPLRKKKENGLWGFVDTSGKVVIDCQYDNVHDFFEDVTLVRKDKLWGFINKEGKVIVPFQFLTVQKYLNAKLVRAKTVDFWYLYNLKGELVIDESFDDISPIISKKMTVRRRGKAGLLSIDGTYLIKPKYEEIYYSGGNVVRVKKRGKYGYKTVKGKRAVPIKYQELGRFYGSRAKAKRKDKWGIIDKKGKKVLKFRFEYIGEYTYDSYLQDYYAPYVYGTRVGKISSWGASVPFEYEEVADESKRIDTDLIRVRFGKDYGAVNNKGQVVIMPFYKNPFEFKEGVAVVTDGKKFGFINKEGKIVYPMTLDSAEGFENGKALVIKNGKEIELSLKDLKL